MASGEPLLQFLREQGVTAIHAMPGRANVIAGQTGVFRTAGGTTAAMELRFPAGILINLGETPKQTYAGKLPATRMGTASLVRNALAQAQGYARKNAAKDEEKRPSRNLKHEALEPALAGKIPVFFSAHRADDLATALRLAKEFKLQAVLDLATEGYLMAEQIGEQKVPVIVHPTMQPRGRSLETYHAHSTAALRRQECWPSAPASKVTCPENRVLPLRGGNGFGERLGWDQHAGNHARRRQAFQDR